jgi:hypothetical protein
MKRNPWALKKRIFFFGYLFYMLVETTETTHQGGNSRKTKTVYFSDFFLHDLPLMKENTCTLQKEMFVFSHITFMCSWRPLKAHITGKLLGNKENDCVSDCVYMSMCFLQNMITKMSYIKSLFLAHTKSLSVNKFRLTLLCFKWRTFGCKMYWDVI